jgi:hypothetical protein
MLPFKPLYRSEFEPFKGMAWIVAGDAQRIGTTLRSLV